MLLKFARSKFLCQNKQNAGNFAKKSRAWFAGENDNAQSMNQVTCWVFDEDFVMDADAQGESCSSVAVTYISSWEIEKLTKIGYVTSLVFWFSGLMRFKQGSRSTASAEIHVYMTWYILVVCYIHIYVLVCIHIYTYVFYVVDKWFNILCITYNMILQVCAIIGIHMPVPVVYCTNIPVVPGQAGGGSFQKEKNYIAKKEFAYRMCARQRAFCRSMVVMSCALKWSVLMS